MEMKPSFHTQARRRMNKNTTKPEQLDLEEFLSHLPTKTQANVLITGAGA